MPPPLLLLWLLLLLGASNADDAACDVEGVAVARRSTKYVVGRAHQRGAIFARCDAHGALACFEDPGLADAPAWAFPQVPCDARAIHARRRQLGVAINLKEDKWPNGLVFYRFSEKNPLAAHEKDMVRQAIAMYEATDLGVAFQECEPKELCRNMYIDISQKEDACYSYVGFTGEGGGQIMNLGKSCFEEPGTAVHELGHALGLYHEHTHPEREVIVLTDSNLPVSASNYAKETDALFKPYDKASIMHYGRSAGLCLPKDQYPLESFCDVEITTNCVMPKKTHCNNTRNSEIGQRTALSPGDLNTLKAIYGTQKPTKKPTQAPSSSSPSPAPSPSSTDGSASPSPSPSPSPPATTKAPEPTSTTAAPTSQPPSPPSPSPPTATTTAPPPASSTPQPSTTAPTSTPTPTTTAPPTTAPTPTTTTPDATTTTTAPAATTTAPAATTTAPAPSITTPTVTSRAPATTAPATSTTPSSSQSPAPSTLTKAPSASPPATTEPATMAPDATTLKPSVTVKPSTTTPATTAPATRQPATTAPASRVPSTTTLPPSPASSLPSQSQTTRPSTTTARPPATTRPVPTTKRPTATTVEPTLEPSGGYRPGNVIPDNNSPAWWNWWNSNKWNKKWADLPGVEGGNGKWWQAWSESQNQDVAGESDHSKKSDKPYQQNVPAVKAPYFNPAAQKAAAAPKPTKATSKLKNGYSFRGWWGR